VRGTDSLNPALKAGSTKLLRQLHSEVLHTDKEEKKEPKKEQSNNNNKDRKRDQYTRQGQDNNYEPPFRKFNDGPRDQRDSRGFRDGPRDYKPRFNQDQPRSNFRAEGNFKREVARDMPQDTPRQMPQDQPRTLPEMN